MKANPILWVILNKPKLSTCWTIACQPERGGPVVYLGEKHAAQDADKICRLLPDWDARPAIVVWPSANSAARSSLC